MSHPTCPICGWYGCICAKPAVEVVPLAPSRDTLMWVLTGEIGDEGPTPLELLDDADFYLRQIGRMGKASQIRVLRERIKDALHEGATECDICRQRHGREVVHPCE